MRVRDGVCWGVGESDFVKIGSRRFFVKLDRAGFWEMWDRRPGPDLLPIGSQIFSS